MNFYIEILWMFQKFPTTILRYTYSKIGLPAQRNTTWTRYDDGNFDANKSNGLTALNVNLKHKISKFSIIFSNLQTLLFAKSAGQGDQDCSAVYNLYDRNSSAVQNKIWL